MEFSTLDTLFNLALLLFWFRIWTPTDDQEVSLNPYVAPMGGLADSLIRALRPIGFGAPPPAIAAVALLILIVFRGLAVPCESLPWVLSMGLQLSQADAGGIAAPVVFSFLSFAVFLFKLWTLSVLLTGPGHPAGGSLAQGAVYFVARPFSDLWAALRPLLLLVLGMDVAFLLGSYGKPVSGLPISHLGAVSIPDWRVAPLPLLPVKLGFCALSGGVDVLAIFVQILVWLIMLSWLCQLMAMQEALVRCREWIDLFLGRMRRLKFHVGIVDLTPVVAVVLLLLTQVLLQGILISGYVALP